MSFWNLNRVELGRYSNSYSGGVDELAAYPSRSVRRRRIDSVCFNLISSRTDTGLLAERFQTN